MHRGTDILHDPLAARVARRSKPLATNAAEPKPTLKPPIKTIG